MRPRRSATCVPSWERRVLARTPAGMASSETLSFSGKLLATRPASRSAHPVSPRTLSKRKREPEEAEIQESRDALSKRPRSSFQSSLVSLGDGSPRGVSDAVVKITDQELSGLAAKARRKVVVLRHLRSRRHVTRPEELSHLEAEAVGPATSRDYVSREAAFKQWLSENHLDLNWDEEGLTATRLLEYLDHLFLDQHLPPDAGTKLIAAIGHLHPRYFRQAKSGCLVRVGRALRGWTKLMPQMTFAPWPLCAAMGIANEMCRRGRPRMGLLTIIDLDVYLRPGAFAELLKENIIPGHPELGPSYRHWSILAHRIEENQKANKVGIYNENILLDSPDRQYLTVELIKIFRSLRRHEKLCDFTMSEWTNMWCRCRDYLCLPKAPVYMLRHIGASDDTLRGSWKSELSKTAEDGQPHRVCADTKKREPLWPF